MAATTLTYKRSVLAIDSRSRENADLTTPSKYRINFPPIRNVKMIRLLSTEIPNSEYTINDHNHMLFLWDSVTNTEHDVTLSNGSYTATEIANELNKQLNAALGVPFGTIFQVTVMPMTSKLRIERVDKPKTFQLRFSGKTGTAAEPLGFDPKSDSVMVVDAFSGNQYTQSNSVVNLSGENFVFLCIKGLPTVTTTERINDVFAKIIYNVGPANIAFDSFVSNAFIYPEPQAQISQLEVSFVRSDGFLVDFNDSDHSFTLEIFTL